MRYLFLLTVIAISAASCSSYKNIPESTINQVIDQWHDAAARADFEDYFDLMTTDAVFIGTDATENWQLAEFRAFAKPFFDKGKAWSFTPLQRNIYTKNGVVYFDELLSTQMGICRGSGIVVMESGKARIAHYVLSIAVPNENVSSLTETKKLWEAEFIDQLKKGN